MELQEVPEGKIFEDMPLLVTMEELRPVVVLTNELRNWTSFDGHYRESGSAGGH